MNASAFAGMMTRSLPAAFLLLSLVAGAAAFAVQVAPAPAAPVDPMDLGWSEPSDGWVPPPCLNRLPFVLVEREGGVAFELTHTPEGPFALEGLRYTLYPRPEAQLRADFRDGTFVEAADAPDDAMMRLEEGLGAPRVLDAGDRLVVASPDYAVLDVIDAEGQLVGGTWTCDW